VVVIPSGSQSVRNYLQPIIKCAICKVEVTDSIPCGSCKGTIGFCCTNLSEQSYRKYTSDRKAAWKCLCCRKDAAPTDSKVSSASSKQADFDSIMSELKEMKRQLACLPTLVQDVKTIKTELAEVKDSCEFNSGKLDECASRLQQVEIKLPELESINNTLNDKINAMGLQLSHLKNELISRDQWLRLNNVEIKGVPLKKNENLFTIMDSLCQVVGYPVHRTSINYISRIPVHNSKEKSIIVSFANRYIKEDFIASARVKKSILADEIGFNDNHQKIYVNDHLTPEYKQLLTKTKTALKAKGYMYVWVKFAKIHVRKDDNSRIYVINSENDLNKLL
jgi:hypothetical protein